MNDSLEFDREHVWHPYTSMVDPLPVYPVASATGVRIRLADGRELIDGMSSWWCAIHGYNHPDLNAAVRAQLDAAAHVMFGGLTHRPATDLARTLVELTPPGLQHVFFCDSGSVAVEVAIKMAIQYWRAVGRPGKHRLATIRGGYHGDTFGAMGICDPVTGMHERFRHVLPEHLFAARPRARPGEALHPDDLAGMAQLLAAHHQEVAAVVLEPVVQGAGGMWFYAPEYLNHVKALCDRYDVLLVFDEIATGFGRTGPLFACEHADVEPDILCLGKALTGGYMSLAATLTTSRVAHGISQDGGVLMHGPTFMANPLACAVAKRSIDLLFENDWPSQVSAIESQLASGLAPYAAFPHVRDVRVFGAIGVVQTRDPVDVAAMQRVFVEAGVWIRPFNDLVYLMPPYVISPDDLERVTKAVGLGLDAIR
ncbi:MAG: adenosylmethionine--8-amino-7-oxononanoate transaminase [Gammaproteobacteria bacterium]|nr:adenosylmethionine--8-amino-7-oxononanoate transaminase [Gammaproteobacteria bacterium]